MNHAIRDELDLVPLAAEAFGRAVVVARLPGGKITVRTEPGLELLAKGKPADIFARFGMTLIEVGDVVMHGEEAFTVRGICDDRALVLGRGERGGETREVPLRSVTKV
jgi:hypothetical protein